ncbi:pyridine nucleotide-disulfide oxidoreductase family protein [Xylariales sp. PMI_506]|nr:pyridine nucleotide-disulfide oxidoreductase family protein [Xylariales sp. PMI_506]
MRLQGALAVALASAVVSGEYSTRPVPTSTYVASSPSYPVGTPTEACAIVSASWAAQTATAATPTVEAALAYQCLNSVPIDKEGALKYIDGIKPYFEWQSDASFKKNPPEDYFYPPYDFWAEIDRIREGVENDEYGNEYEWQLDFYQSVYGPGHDGHFVVYSDLLTPVTWARPLALVSVSENGTSLPVIKVYSDIISNPDTASVLKSINGLEAVEFIQSWIFQVSGNQDADAAYNSMFFSKAYNLLGSKGYFSNGGRVRFIYPGDTTKLTFENGTELEITNVANLGGDWTGVTDGPAAFRTFCPGAITTGVPSATPSSTAETTTATTSATISTSTTAAATPTGLTGYPPPVIISSDSVVSGYYLEDYGFAEVAVLVMTSFEPDSPPEFQATVQDFFAQAVADGKTQLVVDVQVNGGGYIFQGYDTFRQLFPDIVQNGTGRWRWSSGFEAVADVTSAACPNFDPNTASDEEIETCDSTWNWRYDLDVADDNFNSFEDKFGPVTFNNDSFTHVMQWNFSNPLDTINSTWGMGMDITGYGSRTNFTRPFGGPENIVIVFDGYCASTCTLFAQFLKWDAGVKSVALGGRPQEGPIQGVGGVKGSQSLGYSSILGQVQLAANQTTNETLLAEFNRYTTYPLDRSPTTSLNAKDEILRDHLVDGTPAQFVTEYSDCRIYWTEDMHRNITAVWRAAASAAFQGGECAHGGITGYPTSPPPSKRDGPSGAAAPAPLPLRSRGASTWKPVDKTPEFMAKHYMKVVD